mgnify:CR=1 FL=1
MNERKSKNYEIALIAISVAMIIGGGIAIYMISAVFPIPGSKYVMMAPVLSTILYVIQMKLKDVYTIAKFGGVFALTMSIINLFMGLAILVTTLFTHVSIVWMRDIEKRAFWGSILFAGYTGLCALTITKIFIGGIVDDVPYFIFIIIGLACSIFGILGTIIAKRVLKHLPSKMINE